MVDPNISVQVQVQRPIGVLFARIPLHRSTIALVSYRDCTERGLAPQHNE
jgi:hypothetical protein